MRNVTLSLPRELLRRARVLAAKRDTSVSRLMTEALAEVVSREDDYDEVWAAEAEVMRRGLAMRVGTIAWTRADVHER